MHHSLRMVHAVVITAVVASCDVHGKPVRIFYRLRRNACNVHGRACYILLHICGRLLHKQLKTDVQLHCLLVRVLRQENISRHNPCLALYNAPSVSRLILQGMRRHIFHRLLHNPEAFELKNGACDLNGDDLVVDFPFF